jgi:hypothetical protein
MNPPMACESSHRRAGPAHLLFHEPCKTSVNTLRQVLTGSGQAEAGASPALATASGHRRAGPPVAGRTRRMTTRLITSARAIPARPGSGT